MRISELLKNKDGTLFSAREDESVEAAIRIMQIERIGVVLVLGPGGNLLGTLSEREIVSNLATRGPSFLKATVGQLMERQAPTASPQDRVQDAMAVMTTKRVRHLPVVEGNRVVGIISIGDVVKSRLDELAEENRLLQEIARVQTVAERMADDGWLKAANR